jgi:hypothetical protein
VARDDQRALNFRVVEFAREFLTISIKPLKCGDNGREVVLRFSAAARVRIPDVVFVRVRFRALVVEFQIDGGTAPGVFAFEFQNPSTFSAHAGMVHQRYLGFSRRIPPCRHARSGRGRS